MVEILSGKFTDGNNFSGYPVTGKRVHIPARQLEAIGITKDSKITFPFYCLVEEREFPKLDADRNPTGETFKRIQACSTFLEEDAMIDATDSNRRFAIKREQKFRALATSIGVTTEELTALSAATI
jgi:hypothetical protein